jgi:hypothetical protein
MIREKIHLRKTRQLLIFKTRSHLKRVCGLFFNLLKNKWGMANSKHRLIIFVLVMFGGTILKSTSAQIQEIVLKNPNSLSVDTLQLKYVNNKFTGTFKITNQTGNNAKAITWKFSDNAILESCMSYPSLFDSINKTVKFQNSLPDLELSIKPDFEKNITIYNL